MSAAIGFTRFVWNYVCRVVFVSGTHIPKRRWLTVIATAGTLAVVMFATATWFGVGVAAKVLRVDDGEVWVWSPSSSQAKRVNVHSGFVDAHSELADAYGHDVTVLDDDRNLLLHDRTVGKVTSVNLANLDTLAEHPVPQGVQTAVAMWEGKVLIVDTAAGTASTLRPDKLNSTGPAVKLGRGVTPGEFDGKGGYWLASSADGELLCLRIVDGKVRVEQRKKIAPNHELRLSALDSGVAVVDSTAKTVTLYTESEQRIIEAGDLQGAQIAPRTIGKRIAVTLSAQRTVLVISEDGVRRYAIPGEGNLDQAMVYGDRLYVADTTHRTLVVLNLEGSVVEKVPLPDGDKQVQFSQQDGQLLVTAPGSEQALFVDPHATVRQVRTDQLASASASAQSEPSKQPQQNDQPSKRPARRSPNQVNPGSNYSIPQMQLPFGLPASAYQYSGGNGSSGSTAGRATNGSSGTNIAGRGINGVSGRSG